ncbi:MAG: NAD(P)/FAD-dependent oxidoreductase, partial [Moraxellaceae bacterium]
ATGNWLAFETKGRAGNQVAISGVNYSTTAADNLVQFNGKTAEDLSLCKDTWYADQNITLYLNDPVKEINKESKTVHSALGRVVQYDHLIMATGSAPFVPNLPGIKKEGVFVYRTIEDLELIKSYAASAKKGVVMGGGLLGLEAAKALMDLELEETSVIEYAPRLMPRQIDQLASDILQAKLKSLGLSVHLNKGTTSIEGHGKVEALRFNDATELPADILVISAGIRPRDELAKLSGLEVGTHGGIVVNQFMQTSDPSIFAIGECAVFDQLVYGLIAPGYEMAEVAATKICCGSRTFKGFDMSTKLKLIGVDVASFGDPFVTGPGARTIVFEDTNKGIYKRINISNDGQFLLGGILVGDAEAYNMLLQTVTNAIILPPNPEDLLMGARGAGQPQGAGVAGLPDEALICSCEGPPTYKDVRFPLAR